MAVEMGLGAAGASVAPPYLPPVLVRRERLEQALERSTARALTVVTGPAGSGKTVLLASWAAHHPVAWISLRPEHAGLARLERDLVDALRALDLRPELDAGVPAGDPGRIHLHPPPAGTPRRILVLDDLHVLRGPALGVVAGLVARYGGVLGLAVASRSDPDLSLGRLRLEGRLGELRAQDLAFTTEEAAELMHQHGLALHAGQLERLVWRTEGWPAGLRLAALSLEGEADVDRFVDDFAGDDHAVADYLSREVLAQQPPELRDFLLRTSIADRLSGDLADALTGRSDGARTLMELYRGGVFLQPLDRQDHAFRFHPLFAEHLRARLALEHPGLEPRLHARAARWLIADGQEGEALAHALRAGDPQAMAELLADQWLHLLLGPEPPAMALQAVGLRPADRRLVLVAAAACVEAGDLARARELLGADDDDDGGTEETGAFGALLRARIAGDVDAARRAAARLLGLHGADGRVAVSADDARRSLALLHLGVTEFDAGCPDRAEEALAAASALAVDGRRERVLLECLGRSAALEVLAGRLVRAEAAASAALALARSSGWQRTRACAWAWASLATVHWLRDDLEAAERAAENAMQAAHGAAEVAVARSVRLLRAHLAGARGDVARARALHRSGLDGTKAGSVESRWSHALGPCTWPGAEADEPDDPLVGAIARLAAGDALSALRRAEGLVDPRQAVHPTRRLHAWLVVAVARQAGGRAPEASEAVERALEIAALEGYRRPFADGAGAVRRLLQRHTALSTAYAPVVAELLEARDGGSSPLGGLVEPLSERERDVLRLLPTLLSNTEIAGELFVSVNTLKTHVKSIYRKLEVSSRREAVARARRLQLI